MNASIAWLKLVSHALTGRLVSPRGTATRELPQKTIEVDMSKPVVAVKDRKLNYRFMAAEAYWILSGSDFVADIAPWNKHISAFSDDGERFAGAYGPKVVDQLDYVVNKLDDDRESRQAVMSIWRENPAPSKDIPCTVALAFNVRSGLLNAHVFMRSNDVWLGTPYDVFNFSMIAHMVCAQLNQMKPKNTARPLELTFPGSLYLTAASSHIYEQNWKEAGSLLDKTLPYVNADSAYEKCTPSFMSLEPKALMDALKVLRDSKPGDSARWWE